MLKPIDELKVRIGPSAHIPDPVHIETTGDWYVLDHISSGLVAFDSDKKKFVPLLAESWSSKPDGTHLFQLRPGIKFHDGTPITAKDILWTIKRQLIYKTSTHFRFWEYIVGCENIKSLTDECEGLKVISEHEIAISLKAHTDSFFLQMASPETGIWSSFDIDPQTAKLSATKFSGPYYFEKHDDKSAILKRNENSLVSQKFKNSPRSLLLKAIPLAKVNQALIDREIDLTFRSHQPFAEPDWSRFDIRVKANTPSSIIYLYGLGQKNHKPIGRDFIEILWNQNKDQVLTAAETFLPFAKNYGLSRSTFLEQLSFKTAPVLRILCLEGFFAPEFINQLSAAAEAVGTKIEYFYEPMDKWYATFSDPMAAQKYDYILSSYAASERYPSVQLRYITGPLPKPPIDLKKAELPELDGDAIAVLKDYQKWLLKSHQVVPLYFNIDQFLYQKNIDLGAQPSSDAEIELWRVQEKVM